MNTKTSVFSLALVLLIASPIGAQQERRPADPAAQPDYGQAGYSQPSYGTVGQQATGKPVGSQPQARLMARRAAIADAQRQLAEMIFGVRIDSQTLVRDFVTESDEIATNIRAVVRGAEVVDTRYLPDGTVEVDMEVPVYRVQGVLGRRFAYAGDVFRATGTGVPNPVRGDERAPVIPPEDDYDFRALIVSATGTGAVPPRMAGTAQGYAMAKRAAQLDAYRNLGENIMGVRVDSDTYVRDFVTESDEIRTRFQGFIRGAQIVEVRELPEGIVEVDMQIALDDLGNILLMPSQPTPRNESAGPPPPAGRYGATGQGQQNPVNRRQSPAPAPRQGDNY